MMNLDGRTAVAAATVFAAGAAVGAAVGVFVTRRRGSPGTSGTAVAPSAGAGGSASATTAGPEQDDGLPLEMDPQVYQQLVEHAVGFTAEYLAKLPETRASHIATIDNPDDHTDSHAVCRKLHDPVVPARGTSFKSLLDVVNTALPCGMNHAHPGFMAFVGGPALPVAAVGALLDATFNRYTGVWQAAPGLVQLENNLVEWFCRMVGYLPANPADDPSPAPGKPRPSGTLLSGGSMANFTALVTARHKLLAGVSDFSQAVIYCSSQTHHCVHKGATCAGFPASSIRTVPCDESNRIDVDALQEMVTADKAIGLRPFFVVGNGGTTNTGQVDDLPALADIAAGFGLWLHVDAAYGGFFVMTKRGKSILAGLERADSVSMDAHKSLFQPHGVAALLVQDEAALTAAHGATSAYMPESQSDLMPTSSFCDKSVELTRPYRGLGPWLTIKLHGIKAFEAALDEKLDLAQRLFSKLRVMPNVKVMWKPVLSIVTFVYDDGVVRTTDARNALTRMLMSKVNDRGNSFLSPTVVDDIMIIRACILQFRTHQSHVDDLVEDIREAAAGMAQTL